ncbi:glutathione-dependent formaldehyde-activating, GFA [Xylaria bambusicola]|uniref:glutathione-dependent formaldehyde-activating, GFA n=1 Tax=Xylaria bambusicola TaxID=326684 RepID=UPI0020083FC0|nr:glutathione-dependent formaldehyde-activating, GFA [Xylaria bambusicola]KAI0506375.1 glutathione-dependent formaldehyde-activating, GFA [Xylaria bambusicola]
MVTKTGSCLCGGIKVLIQGAPAMTNLCHCTSCQKFSGAVFAPLAVYKTTNITFSESEPSLMKTYDDTSPESGRVVKRMFCGRCGSSLGGVRGGMEDMTIVVLGLLDGDKSDLKPQFEFFRKSKVDWIDSVSGSQCFETLPPGA